MRVQNTSSPNKRFRLRRFIWTAARAVAGFGLAGFLIYNLTHDPPSQIGVRLENKESEITVGMVYPDGVADRAGIQEGERILAISELAGEWTDLVENHDIDVAKLLGGVEGTSIRLRLEHDGQARELTLVREAMLLTRLWRQLKGGQPMWLTLAFLSFGAVLLITFYRWYLLLRVQNIDIGFLTVARLGFIGVFFNLVLPGAVTGDLVKMAYISQHSRGKAAEATLTIMLDRVVGLFGLFVIASIACVLCLDLLREIGGVLQGATALIAFFCVSGFIAILCVQFRERLQKLPFVPQMLELGERLLPDRIVSIVRRLVAALDMYRNQKKTVGVAMLLSMLVHCLTTGSLYCLGQALRVAGPSLRHYFLAMQVGNTVAAIPLTPSGFGTRDYVIREFLIAAGALPQEAVALAVLYTLIFSIWFLLGGPVFIFSRFQENVSAESSDQSSAQPDDVEGLS